MADIKNCKRCTKAFLSSNFEEIFCKSCGAEEQKLYKELREYVLNNPGVSAYDLSQTFNIRIDRITRFINRNRLNPL